METRHTIFWGDARDMSAVPDASVHLVVTSPPYPMVEMWDQAFGACDPEIAAALDRGEGWQAFEGMHRVLDAVWQECHRALAPGGLLCVNVGNATRTIHKEFCFYPNTGRILHAVSQLGMTPLPDILWRKPTNAPNKFMGSGMLPPGAYVTYEHESILIFRKGARRKFSAADKARRRESAYFWEERNAWFSDLWSGLWGARQDLSADPALRARSAAFPLEIPYRLIHMYSLYGDTVLDPFAGTGTTLVAAAVAARNGIGFEREPAFSPQLHHSLAAVPALAQATLQRRLDEHRRFVQDKPSPHASARYQFPVVTRQEREVRFYLPTRSDHQQGTFHLTYQDL